MGKKLFIKLFKKSANRRPGRPSKKRQLELSAELGFSQPANIVAKQHPGKQNDGFKEKNYFGYKDCSLCKLFKRSKQSERSKQTKKVKINVKGSKIAKRAKNKVCYNL
jgi:hypothetical protein